jgi:SAM-dependent methyltransferase
MRRLWAFLLLAFVSVALAYVAWQAVLTLLVLDQIETERDSWQRPDAVIASLDLHPGQTVVDFGAGAGYFALKLVPVVGPAGAVLATDVRRESLTFLWMRSHLKRDGSIHVIHGDEQDPHLAAAAADAVLISNAYHELSAPRPMIALLRDLLKRGGRLVILDRAPRGTGDQVHEDLAPHHELALGLVENDVRQAGFIILSRDARFIDRGGPDDVWWLLVAQKP